MGGVHKGSGSLRQGWERGGREEGERRERGGREEGERRERGGREEGERKEKGDREEGGRVLDWFCAGFGCLVVWKCSDGIDVSAMRNRPKPF